MHACVVLGMYKKQIQEEEKTIASLNRRIRDLEVQVDHQRKYMGGYALQYGNNALQRKGANSDILHLL